jgi:hypothetical protein
MGIFLVFFFYNFQVYSVCDVKVDFVL